MIPPYRPYPQASYRPPPRAHRPKVWEQAVKILHGPAPDLPAVFMQRDFHPGNVLWWRGAVSGVVGHCRANLLGFSRDVADRFTRLWEKAAATTYHPWIDVVTVMDFLDDLRQDWGSERLVVEDVLASAVRELT